MSTPISQYIAQKAVDILNEALAADRKAVMALLNYRVSVNDGIADHPEIVCMQDNVAGGPVVGLLGMVNGIVTRQTGELICAVYDDEAMKSLVRFGITSVELKDTSAKKIVILPPS